MPLHIQNNYDHVSLNDLLCMRASGYSVLRSPHVGNQHLSSLVCAALQIPLEMVSFTQGLRDQNSWPHLRIQNGKGAQLYNPCTWTQFASVSDGRTATQYHQSAVQQVFPDTEVLTDMERMQQYPALTATVLRATNQRVRGLWYRRASADGYVSKRTQSQLSDSDLETNVFQFSNAMSGWVIPNRVHIIFDLIYQALSSGRDVVYHLSGPQMVQYISNRKLQYELQLMYDAVRQCIPELPLVLKVRIVPVAGARFAGLPADASRIKAVCDTIDSVGVENANVGWYQELAAEVPSVTMSIETGATLSQYDLQCGGDLYLDPWMLHTPLATVNLVQRTLAQASRAVAAE
jgi:hypothetical protein